MSGPLPITIALAALAGKAEGVKVSLPYEPGQSRLPEMPCTTVLFSGVDQIDQMTGPMQEVHWHFELYLYVNFADAERAQAEMFAIVPQLVRIVRINPSLDGSCELAIMTDALSIPELGPEDRWLRKRLHFDCRLEET